MKITRTAIEDVIVVEPDLYGDSRGFFFESFNQRVFGELTGVNLPFVQDNHSKSSKGVLRGLHYQLAPHSQGKLVRVIQGEVFDVAVDIRRESDTFGRWVGINLSQDNKKQLWIPPGFAHGFVVLTDSAEFLYKTTNYYMPQSERCLLWNDPDLAIDWPIEEEPILAEKDRNGHLFSQI